MKGYQLKVSTKWSPYVAMDHPRSMFYARMLSIVDQAEMKVGRHYIDFIDHEGDCGVYF